MAEGLFDFDFTPAQKDFYLKYKDMSDEEFYRDPSRSKRYKELFPDAPDEAPLEPLQPMPSPLPPGMAAQPDAAPPVYGNTGTSSMGMGFDAGTRVPPPSAPLPDANGGLGLLPPGLNMSTGLNNLADESAGSEGGGLLGGMGGGKWGPMLMALGGGIASTPGNWGAGIGAGFQNAGNARQKQDALDQQRAATAAENAYKERALQATAAAARAKPTGTDDQQEYAAAVAQGYTGTFMDYMQAMKKASGTNVNVTTGGEGPKYGPLGPGQIYIEDKTQPGGVRIINATGGKGDLEEKAALAKSSKSAEYKAEKSDIMLDSVAAIRQVQKDSTLPTTGTFSRAPAVYSESGAAELRGHVNTLKSGVALSAMTLLKEASKQGATGFGNMNKPELQLLLDELGSLDPDGNKAVFDKTIDSIERRWKRIQADAKKEVSPERWQELNLDDVFGPQDAPSGGGAPAGGDPLGIR